LPNNAYLCSWSNLFIKTFLIHLNNVLFGQNEKMRSSLLLLFVLYLVLPTLSFPLVNATEDSWTTMESMPTARMSPGVAVVNGKIYALSGEGHCTLTANDEYDITTNTWSNKTPMPTERYYFGTAVVDDKIYVIGGQNQTHIFNMTEIYDPHTDTWETKSSSQTTREFPVVNAVNGKIYVMAGFNRFNPLLIPYRVNVTEIYNPATDSWTTGAPMPDFVGEGSLQTLASAIIDDKIYLIVENTTRIYDTKTDKWNYGAPFPATVHGAAAGATTGEFAPKKMYVMGGVVSSNYVLNNLTYVYDLETDNWTIGAPMLTPRYRLSIAVADDKLYAIGGYDGAKYYKKNEVYTPSGYIPEFPSWIVVPFFIIAVVAVIIYRKKLVKKLAC
jgi:N-acetylneuraminic acid mutarotase